MIYKKEAYAMFAYPVRKKQREGKINIEESLYILAAQIRHFKSICVLFSIVGSFMFPFFLARLITRKNPFLV
jgi:hypothetical protein